MDEHRVEPLMTREQALAGSTAPDEVLKSLSLVDVPFFGFDGETHRGQLVVASDLADEVREMFGMLADRRFPIDKMVPIVAYGWDDDASMADDNTSAFNYRVIFGTDRLSNHSGGRAIDINPRINPYVRNDGSVMPSGAVYDPTAMGAVTGPVVDLFLSHGWSWGGDWTDRKDWQHFEKPH